ncbi:MAG: purine-nucleoside phosphorylase [Saprospiraceae bacterium]|jgi:purine-nucleoside phosphorylase|uniref:purine-nucleoside phosphorylase n=1 Tax=Candidatus Brachybacter algidus TaxID=2982024 RepID=UPI001B6F2C40|nr:purine-nucleoside phosphorylase [Candidatus Brachybacter algidus]MBP7304560.1 purine-nucleoside phosphorylase [Saprospiraceae bacterium]MBK6372366.1 purine-nucleoside phosphorylase [Candidatus Brachybacter algidus]MBK6450188.1 purine-nucleoside phosphorylase [Candidatus Brachybacter algidus]MBK7603231.1 purine-nucleoside phosphorylase [Candidatus Brachybacter algidus]MBK8604083.1 purine-nucleoside phosphorylase [Candidatus Brachybacter algidus]
MEEFNKAREYLIEKGVESPVVGIVLGSGLNNLMKHVDVKLTIPYADIPGFPISTVEFHKGNLVFGTIGDKNVLIMHGRMHAYEGYSLQEIVFPIRVMKLLGIQKLFLSNAVGGINLNFKKGDLILIDDHINLLYGNPLTGRNFDELGPRFPDMSEPYDVALKKLFLEKAVEIGIALKKGIYAAVHGPNLETKAEYRHLKIIGADMVGMSTVPEVIAANHMSLPCIAISVITDECDPENLKAVNIAEIIETAGKADLKLSKLFVEVIKTF